MKMFELFKSDIEVFYPKFSIKNLIKALVNPSIHACFFIRIMTSNRSKVVHILLRNILIWKHSIDVGYGVTIGRTLHLPHPLGIVIGDGVEIGNSVSIYHNCTLGNKRGEYPNIKDGVCIYPNTTIVGGIIIGENAIIGANSFVDKDVKEESCFKSGNS
jgi:serine O-acetyltransferase